MKFANEIKWGLEAIDIKWGLKANEIKWGLKANEIKWGLKANEGCKHKQFGEGKWGIACELGPKRHASCGKKHVQVGDLRTCKEWLKRHTNEGHDHIQLGAEQYRRRPVPRASAQAAAPHEGRPGPK